MANFGERLAELMIEKQVSSQILAKDIGVTSVCVNRWKRNAREIGLADLIALCNYFECSLDYLVGKSDNDRKPSKKTIPHFGEQIRAVMKVKGANTYKMRKETRYNGKYFHDWDKGSEPQLSTLIELANYFDCSLDELVGLD